MRVRFMGYSLEAKMGSRIISELGDEFVHWLNIAITLTISQLHTVDNPTERPQIRFFSPSEGRPPERPCVRRSGSLI